MVEGRESSADQSKLALQNTLYVFSTQRAINDFYARLSPHTFQADVLDSAQAPAKELNSAQNPAQLSLSAPLLAPLAAPSLVPGIMPKALTIGELFSLSFFAPAKISPSKQVQKILLQAILRECLPDDPALTHSFIFDKSFLGYLQGSDFLLPFFRELGQHGIDIAKIPLRDIYADYEEHLRILEDIYTRFSTRLDELGLARIDEAQEIVPTFLAHFSQIEIMLDGILSPKEREKLYAISRHVPLRIHIATDRYNHKYFQWLYKDIEPNHAYIFIMDSRGLDSHAEYSAPTMESATPIKAPPLMELYGFELRIAQCSFVLEKVRELLASGVRGEEIIIVTPDEGFSKYFALLDSAGNLNYAMGRESLSLPKYAAWYKALRALLLSQEFIATCGVADPLGVIEEIFSYVFGASTKTTQSHINQTPLDECLLSQACQTALDSLPPCPLPPKERARILAQIFDFHQIYPVIQTLGYEWILELILLQIEQCSIDDTQGGKVRVMGILETRGITCEYAIVVDCNHGFIPRIKESDVFLNSTIRQALGMPTLQDRENLQKHYYQQLFVNTHKGIFLTATINEESKESSLIDELCLHHEVRRFDGDAHYALFPQSTIPQYIEEEIVEALGDFTFSATSLNTFGTCKRKFYLRYVLKLQEPEESGGDQALGILVHKALESSFGAYIGRQISERDIGAIERACEQILRQNLSENATQRFACELALRTLKGFWQRQRDLAKAHDLSHGKGIGLEILACEQGFKAVLAHNGKRYNLSGKLDRIDKLDQNAWRVVDYKYAKHPKQNKKKLDSQLFQLAFYKLALESGEVFMEPPDLDFTSSSSVLGKPARDIAIDPMLYYLREKGDQAERALSQEEFERSKVLILDILTECAGVVDFAKTEDRSSCQACPYKLMCNRI